MQDDITGVDFQSEQYRRGQVLGFTMAEIMLVLLFLLLILLGAQISNMQEEIDRSIAPDSPEARSIILIQEALYSLQAQGLLLQQDDIYTLSQKLTLVAPETIRGLPAQGSLERLLVENERLLDQNATLRSQLSDQVEPGERLAEALDLQRIAEQFGLQHSSAQMCLEGCGGGDGPEACWGESISEPDYIYSVAMFDDRFFVVPDGQNIRANQDSWDSLPELARIPSGEMLTNAELVRRFRPLRAFSDQNTCKFHVRLYDYQTSTKEVFKNQRRLIEGYVYFSDRGGANNWDHGAVPAFYAQTENDNSANQDNDIDIDLMLDTVSDFDEVSRLSEGQDLATSSLSNDSSEPLDLPSARKVEPKLSRKTAPDYPRRAFNNGVEGSCTVEYSVRPSGRVRDAKSVEGLCEPSGYFERASVSTINRWRYESFDPDDPTIKSTGLRQTFRFQLR